MSTVHADRVQMSACAVTVMAGGTGGHIFPALAVADELRARGVPVAWLGAAGAMETRLVPQHGITLDTLPIAGVRGKGRLALLAAPLKLLRAVVAARAALRRQRPSVVIGFGGFASGPGGLAAWLARLPLLVHEQNRAPGLTNRVLSRLARRTLSGFPGSFAGEQVTGNPVRTPIAALPPPDARLAGRTGPLRLLVLGGSQGARALNMSVPRALAALQDVPVEVRHQCGEALRDEAGRAYADAGVEASVEAFISDMADAYAWADLVVCRAGASTLAELCAAGVGSVLVPFAAAVDDHQTRNAEYLVEHGAALLLRQDDALAAHLEQTLRALAADPARRLSMAGAARALARPDAAARIADAVLEAAGCPPPGGDGRGQQQEREQADMRHTLQTGRPHPATGPDSADGGAA